MDSLQAMYKDEEDEEDETALAAVVAPPAVGTDMESQDVPRFTTSIASETPKEVHIDVKLEPDASDEMSEDEAASDGSADQKKSPKSGREVENEEEDEDPPPKKQKQLSSLTARTAKDESPALPDAVEGNNGSGNANGMTPGTGVGTNSKKSKKKSNNVWVTKSTRKGKKKSKTNNNNNPGEDTVLITPVPRFPDKSDDTPEMKICLSKVFKAEKVELSEDRMSAGSTKGYRMVRATRGVIEGAWYFEIKVVKLGETGHTRLGWSTEKGDLQAPVGYDGNSFGYRDIDGSKIHKALRENYGEEGYNEGDVIGFYINLPNGATYAPKAPHLVWYKGQRYVCGPDMKEDPPKVVPGE